ncbi:protein CutA homolog isoform X2 [Orussus abietinus]|nr:protein CutA homolog isoform X2 [Orussus abietinus]XP_012278406.1 protein CutA homolog isoform X2 [Orussus abietinus]
MTDFAGTYSVVYVTTPNVEVSRNIAQGLVTNKLAACVNIIPQIISIYEWEDKIEENSEQLLMIKSRTEVVDALTKFVKEIHPYKVCEVISLPIQNGNADYLKWIGEVVPPIKKSDQQTEKANS